MCGGGSMSNQENGSSILATIRWTSLVTLAVVLIVAALAHAQAVNGSFVGTVRDSSGAVVPGAAITLINISTNVKTTTVTNSSGDYVLPFLDSGTYTLSATAQGFKTAIQKEVKLDVAAQVRVDFKLEIGETAQTVEVISAEPLIETDTSSLGQVITSEELQEIPLLSRNFQQLAELAPAAIEPESFTANKQFVPGLTAGDYYQVAGQRGSYMAYTLDGLDNNNIAWQTIGILPSLDTIQEFKIQDHNFSAEYGRGTVQFTTTTKQGTNSLHGSAYEYLRNDVLNATPYAVNQAGGKKNAFRYNQFGFTIGGPVVLPKYNGKDKTFFFFGYEGTRYSTGGTAFAEWPNPAFLTGDFSALKNPDGTQRIIYDPLTTRPDPSNPGRYIRDPFPGNRISSDRFDPVAVAAIQFIPKPTSLTDIIPNVNTIAKTQTKSSPNNLVARGDHTFSHKDRFYGTYRQSRERLTNSGIAPLSGDIGVHNGYNAMLAETHMFRSTVINELRLGYNRSNVASFQEDGPAGCIGPCPSTANLIADVFHLQNIAGGVNPLTYGLPNFLFTGYSPIGAAISRPLVALTNTYQVSDNLVISHGRHTLKSGFNFSRVRFNFTSDSNARGAFNFNGQFTQGTQAGQTASGNSIADFLLGLANASTGLAGDQSGPYRTGYQGYYFQDDWRVSSRLTLNLGIRWEYFSPFVALADNKNAQFHFGSPPGTCFGFNCPPGYIQTFGKGEPFYNKNLNDWGPRVGFAYSPFANNKTSIRGGYGIFYTPTDSTDSGVWGESNPPVSMTFTLLPDNPFTDITSTKMGHLFPSAGSIIPPVSQLRTDTWPLPPLQLFTDIIGVMKDGAVQQWQLSVQHSITQNLVAEIGYMGSHGVHGSRVIDYNQARLDAPGQTTSVTSRLPYPALSSIMQVQEHSANNKYEAGYFRVEKRFSRGLSFVSSYTFAKTMDDYGNKNGAGHWWAQNSYDKKAEIGLSAFDARQRLSIGYVWQLPIGRGQRWASGMNRVADAFLGGWQASGITVFQHGLPLYPLTNRDWSNTGHFLGPAGGGRPNCVGPVHYLDIRKTGMWFDPSAFAVPTLGTFGNCGTGVMYAPGINNWDLSLSKRFKVRERAAVQFRTEMFNAFNHAQFQYGYNTVRIDPSLTPLQEAGLNSTRPPRNIQLALRVQF